MRDKHNFSYSLPFYLAISFVRESMSSLTCPRPGIPRIYPSSSLPSSLAQQASSNTREKRWRRVHLYPTAMEKLSATSNAAPETEGGRWHIDVALCCSSGRAAGGGSVVLAAAAQGGCRSRTRRSGKTPTSATIVGVGGGLQREHGGGRKGAACLSVVGYRRERCLIVTLSW